MAKVHVIIEIDEGVYARPINGHGIREIESWKSEKDISDALVNIAEGMLPAGMSFQLVASADQALATEKSSF